MGFVPWIFVLFTLFRIAKNRIEQNRIDHYCWKGSPAIISSICLPNSGLIMLLRAFYYLVFICMSVTSELILWDNVGYEIHRDLFFLQLWEQQLQGGAMRNLQAWKNGVSFHLNIAENSGGNVILEGRGTCFRFSYGNCPEKLWLPIPGNVQDRVGHSSKQPDLVEDPF